MQIAVSADGHIVVGHHNGRGRIRQVHQEFAARHASLLVEVAGLEVIAVLIVHGDTDLLHGFHKACQTLPAGAGGQIRGKNGDFSMPLVDQVLRQHIYAAPAVGADEISHKIRACHAAVNQRDGQRLAQLADVAVVFAGGIQDHPSHILALCPLQVLQLQLWVVLRAANHQAISRPAQIGVDHLCHGRKVGIGNIGDQERDDAAGIRFQIPGRDIGNVIDRFNGLVHPEHRLTADVVGIVDDPRHCCDGDARLAGDIFDCGFPHIYYLNSLYFRGSTDDFPPNLFDALSYDTL